MIAVGIYGGLASQMNQYAFLRLLKSRFQATEIKMAIGGDWRRYMEHRGYELDKVFGIGRDAISWQELRRLANFYPGSGLKKKFFNAMYQVRDRLLGPKKTHITLPTSDTPDWSVLNLDVSKDWLFWSNYPMGFFDGIRSELLSEFRFPPVDEENKSILDMIRTTNSVSVHVRRCDYKKYGFPLVDISWYKKVIKGISENIELPRFFIFSDEPEWVEKNFDFLPSKEVVKGNVGDRSWVDMYLMSMCKHNIIANSGYSLFASWLNTNPDKIVVRPNVFPFGVKL